MLEFASFRGVRPQTGGRDHSPSACDQGQDGEPGPMDAAEGGPN
jgi:hypothetical protein